MLLDDFAHCLGSFGDRENEQPIDIWLAYGGWWLHGNATLPRSARQVWVEKLRKH